MERNLFEDEYPSNSVDLKGLKCKAETAMRHDGRVIAHAAIWEKVPEEQGVICTTCPGAG